MKWFSGVFSVMSLVFLTFDVNAEVLVYKWRIAGKEFQLPDQGTEIKRNLNQRGFLVVNYESTTDTYSSPKLVRYWKNRDTKIKYYIIEDFLLGIAEFNKESSDEKPYLNINGFYGGINGEYYSGKITAARAKSVGTTKNLLIAKRLRGVSSWNKTFKDKSTSTGEGLVSLVLYKRFTRISNETGLDVDKTVNNILINKLSAYTESTAQEVVLTNPVFTGVDIESGSIDGTTIGGTTPAEGTFTGLQTGAEGIDGELTIYSEQGDTDYEVVFKPADAMTQNTLYTLPVDDGDAKQLLSTDGDGNLSWVTASSAGGGETNTASNQGAGGVGVFYQKSGVDLQFKNIIAASTLVTVSDDTADHEIAIDVNQSNLSLATIAGGTPTSGNLLISNGTDFESVALSGDATVDSTGAITVADNAITSAKINDGAIVNADLADGADIAWTKVSKTGAALSDFAGTVAVTQLPDSGNWTLNGDLNIDSDTLVIGQSDNRVGVGTSAPGTTFDVKGQVAQSSGDFTSAGDARYRRVVFRRQTTNADQTQLFIDGSSEQLTLTSGTTLGFEIHVSARQTGGSAGSAGDSAFYIIRGLIKRVGDTTSIVGSISSTEVAEDDAAWAVQVDADDTAEALRIRVTGAANKDINWVATVQLTEVQG